MSNFSSQERQRLITMYVTQYNQTNLHITHLFNTLDDIRNNINTLIGNNSNINNNNMHRTNTFAQPNRSNRTPRQNNIRSSNYSENSFNPENSFNQRPYIYYDYANPIDRSTYISDTDTNTNTNTNNHNSDIANFLNDIITNNNTNDQANNNNPNITNFLANFLNSVPIRPTPEQINIASRLVRYSDIQTPNSSSCAISLEPFTPSDSVIQLRHCGHIFFPEQFNQWFCNNVRCPVCRHDIRNVTDATPITPVHNDTNLRNINPINPITNIIDLSNNDISNNLLTSITNGLLSFNDRFVVDPIADHVLLFETIIRSNNQDP